MGIRDILVRIRTSDSDYVFRIFFSRRIVYRIFPKCFGKYLQCRFGCSIYSFAIPIGLKLPFPCIAASTLTLRDTGTVVRTHLDMRNRRNKLRNSTSRLS